MAERSALEIDTILAAGEVIRFHTERMLTRQTVGSHSWRVATIITLVHPNPSANLLKAALFHDVAERWTGDIPSPAKWEWETLKRGAIVSTSHVELVLKLPTGQLTPEEQMWLKGADFLDLLLHLRDELSMGNSTVAATATRAQEYFISNLLGRLPEPLQRFYHSHGHFWVPEQKDPYTLLFGGK